jgi:hypothetical protein
MLLGLHLIKTEKKHTRYTLGVNNQAAITAVATPSNKLGHYLAEHIVSAASKIQKTNGRANFLLTLRWTAGHINIGSNELADKEAKRASEGETSDLKALLKLLRKPLKYNKSTVNQVYKMKIKTAWHKDWQRSPHTQRTKLIDPSLLSNKFLKLISDSDISRKGVSWLYQI